MNVCQRALCRAAKLCAARRNACTKLCTTGLAFAAGVKETASMLNTQTSSEHSLTTFSPLKPLQNASVVAAASVMALVELSVSAMLDVESSYCAAMAALVKALERYSSLRPNSAAAAMVWDDVVAARSRVIDLKRARDETSILWFNVTELTDRTVQTCYVTGADSTASRLASVLHSAKHNADEARQTSDAMELSLAHQEAAEIYASSATVHTVAALSLPANEGITEMLPHVSSAAEDSEK